MSGFIFGKARDKEYDKELKTLDKEWKTLHKKLKEEENGLEGVYADLGSEVYKWSKEGKIEVPQFFNGVLEAIDEYITSIENIKKDISDLELREDQLMIAKSSKVEQTPANDTIICTCGAEVSKNSKFCSSCGKKVEELIAEMSKAEQAPANDTIICTCGAEVNRNSKFCNSCGKKVEDLIAETSKVEQAPVKECICGAKIQPGQFMCLECGRKIE